MPMIELMLSILAGGVVCAKLGLVTGRHMIML
jgi:hypothetical protein